MDIAVSERSERVVYVIDGGNDLRSPLAISHTFRPIHSPDFDAGQLVSEFDTVDHVAR